MDIRDHDGNEINLMFNGRTDFATFVESVNNALIECDRQGDPLQKGDKCTQSTHAKSEK